MAQTEKLPFGESNWDYFPDLLQNRIQYLADRSLHSERMRLVCQSFELYEKWRNQQRWVMENFPNFPEIIICMNDFNIENGKSPFLLNHKFAINVCKVFHLKLFCRNIFLFVKVHVLKILKILLIFIEVFSKMMNTIVIMTIMVIIRK